MASVVIVLSACGSVTPSGAAGTVRPSSPAIGPSSQAVSPIGQTIGPIGQTIGPIGQTIGPIGQTIGPSIPADGSFGAWWNKTTISGTEGGGLLAQDDRANDLRYIAQDKASSDDAALSSDGTRLATDMAKATPGS